MAKIDYKELKRRKIRYWLFRLSTEANGGSKAKGVPTGLRAHFEDNAAFILAGGWTQFGAKWDVDDSGLTIIALEQSLEDKWNDHLEEAAKDLPIADLRSSDKGANA